MIETCTTTITVRWGGVKPPTSYYNRIKSLGVKSNSGVITYDENMTNEFTHRYIALYALDFGAKSVNVKREIEYKTH